MNQLLRGANLAPLLLSSSQLSAVAEITHWYQKTHSDDDVHVMFCIQLELCIVRNLLLSRARVRYCIVCVFPETKP